MPTCLTRIRGRSYLALGMLTLLALGLRLTRLTFQPLWWDEGWSLYFATTDVGTMLELTAVDIHPPLYYLLLHLWIGLVGPSVVSVRLLSVLIGTATVPLLYTTGRRLLGDKGGLLAAFLLALSPFHIYYSQEVRMYGLVTLLGLVALCFALRWKPDLGTWLGYVLAAAAALHTHYYAAFLLLALNLGVLIRWLRDRRPAREVWAWLGAQAAVAALCLPWLWYAGGKLLTYVRFKIGVEKDLPLGFFPYLGRHLAAFTWGHAEGPLTGWWWLGLLPLAVLGLALILLLRAKNWRPGNGHPSSVIRLLPLVILLVLLLGGFLVNLAFPFNPPRSERQLLLALPATLLLVASVLLALWHARRSFAVLALVSFLVFGLGSLGIFYTVPRYPDDDYRPVAARLRALALPGDAILCIHPWQEGYFRAYFPDDDLRPALVLTPREVIPHERQLWADDPALMAADLDTLLTEHGRLWLADHQAMGRVLESQVEAYLARWAYPVLSEWHGKNTVLSLFAAGSPLAQPVTSRFGDWLALDGAALSPGPLQAGWGIVAVDLAWRLSERPAEDYRLGLRLADAAGRVWAQRDGPPGGGLEEFADWTAGEPHLDRHGLLVPAGTPPGDYRLTLRVYRGKGVAVLPASSAGGDGVEVILGTVRVVRPERPPPLEALAFARPLRADLSGRLRLLGYTVHNDAPLLPGETVGVELFWQALADPGEDLLPRLQLLGSGGETLAELVEKPVAGTYPTAWWWAGELVRDPHALPIPAAVPAGRYRLALGLVRAADGQPLEFGRGEATLDLAEVEVQERGRRFEPTTPEHVQVARLGTSVELIGYDLGEARRGSLLVVTLHWHALQTPDRNYHAFVHLLDAGGNIVAQHDGPPGSEGQSLPTFGWLPGEYITDSHPLPIPADLPSGEYRLGVGLYDPNSWQRLGEQVILGTPVGVTGR